MKPDALSNVDRRDFLKLAGAATACSVSRRAFGAPSEPFALIVDPANAAASSGPAKKSRRETASRSSHKGRGLRHSLLLRGRCRRFVVHRRLRSRLAARSRFSQRRGAHRGRNSASFLGKARPHARTSGIWRRRARLCLWIARARGPRSLPVKFRRSSAPHRCGGAEAGERCALRQPLLLFRTRR